MKIAYASDLHLEFGAIDPSQLIADADYLFLAGDIAEARSFGKSMMEEYKDWSSRLYDLFATLSKHYEKVFLTLGNHEYYHSRVGKAESIIGKFCDQFDNVVMLQDKLVDVEGYKVYGATMWTDMGIGGSDPLIEYKLAMGMNDFKLITYQTTGRFSKFKPANAARIHTMNLKAAIKAQPDIILQHHAPCSMSILDRFKSSELNPAYYSAAQEDLLIDTLQPKLIIHGHIHGVHDYIWANTRVLANSRGYVGMEDTDSFKVKVVEIK